MRWGRFERKLCRARQVAKMWRRTSQISSNPPSPTDDARVITPTARGHRRGLHTDRHAFLEVDVGPVDIVECTQANLWHSGKWQKPTS